MKIEQINDVVVKIDILRPQAVVGMGTPAIFVEGTAESCKVYLNLDAIEKDYATNSKVYQKANAILSQKNAGKGVIVIVYPTGKLEETASNYFYEPWHFALLDEFDSDNALILSNLIEEQEFKFLALQVADKAELLPFKNNSLTFCYVHPLDEHLDAAVVGNTGNLTVGSVTWKFRHELVGITEQQFKQSDIDEIDSIGGMVYVNKAGIPQTSEGKTMSGEFIDALHGDHWVKSNLETRIQTLLSTTDKLSFDASGIALLNDAASNVLEQAFVNGIIDRDDETGNGKFAVTTLQRTDLNADDIAARNYKGLSFYYKRSGAIHSVEVTGTIEV